MLEEHRTCISYKTQFFGKCLTLLFCLVNSSWMEVIIKHEVMLILFDMHKNRLFNEGNEPTLYTCTYEQKMKTQLSYFTLIIMNAFLNYEYVDSTSLSSCSYNKNVLLNYLVCLKLVSSSFTFHKNMSPKICCSCKLFVFLWCHALKSFDYCRQRFFVLFQELTGCVVHQTCKKKLLKIYTKIKR